MRNLFYVLLLFFSVTLFCACEKEYTNPGDFSIKSELKVTGVSTRGGKALPFKELRTIDTTYMREYTRKDTLKDASGKPVLDANGKLTIKDVKDFYKSKLTGRFTEIEVILVEAKADTFNIKLNSNALWRAPMPAAGSQPAWFFTTLLAGGGNGTVTARTLKNTANTRRLVNAAQYILTTDSLMMYKLVFSQKAANE